MSTLTRLIMEIEPGSDRSAELFDAVYGELRSMARQFMNRERADHTLGATALVHEAYLRLSGKEGPRWENRAHFFSAAAEAMRRILVDHARHKKAQRCGGRRVRTPLCEAESISENPFGADPVDLLTLDECLTRLNEEYPSKAELVKLLYFAGLSCEEAAAVLGISRSSAHRQWIFARAYLRRAMNVPKTRPGKNG